MKDEQVIGRTWCGRYKILELIGKGGMGTVYKANQIQVDREVALKVIHRRLTHDERSVMRFEKEALASSKLSHPNNIRVYDYGRSEDDRLFIAMEYLRGQTLGDLIVSEGPLHPTRVVHMARQIFKSLAEAHAVGLVHRDLKPENVFICEVHGEPDFVKVLDFGIAKAVGGEGEHANLTQTGFICGTPRYISPEQALGQPVDGRSDLYAVAVLMYEMLSGHPPFQGENPISIVMMHVYDDPAPLVGMDAYGLLGRRLSRLIFHMLEKNPNRRPASSERVLQFLDGRIDESELVARSLADPIPVLTTGELLSTAPLPGASTAPGPALSQRDRTQPNRSLVPPEQDTNRGIPALESDAPASPAARPSKPESTQSEMPTAFTERPAVLQEDDVTRLGVSAMPDEPAVVERFSANQTAQLQGDQIEEAVKLLQERRKSAQGLVRKRPTTHNVRGINRSRGPLTPTPAGSTGLNLKTFPPPPQRPGPPIWALATVGIAIAVISVSAAVLVMDDKEPATSAVALDGSTQSAPPVRASAVPATSAAGPGDAPAPAQPPPPKVVKSVAPAPAPTRAGELVGTRLATVEPPEAPAPLPTPVTPPAPKAVSPLPVPPVTVRPAPPTPEKVPVPVVTPPKVTAPTKVEARPAKRRLPVKTVKKAAKPALKTKTRRRKEKPSGWTF